MLREFQTRFLILKNIIMHMIIFYNKTYQAVGFLGSICSACRGPE